MARETKRKRMHPYRAVFERMPDELPAPSTTTTTPGVVEGLLQDAEAAAAKPEPMKRKLPGIRKDKAEHERLAALQREAEVKEEREKGGRKTEADRLTEEMERMVLDYLNADTRDALSALPPTPTKKSVGKTSAAVVGGGLGGGYWDAPKEEKQEAETDGEDDEDGFVYDVYERVEVSAEEVAKEKGTGEVGVIVFRGEEEQEWWYENDDDEDNGDAEFDTDDEDSNGMSHSSPIHRKLVIADEEVT